EITYSFDPTFAGGGNASGRFVISGNAASGFRVVVAPGAIIDYEALPIGEKYFDIRIIASDNMGGQAAQTFRISVKDVDESGQGETPPNRAPKDIFLSNASVNELSDTGTLIGTLSADDLDFGDSFTYEI